MRDWTREVESVLKRRQIDPDVIEEVAQHIADVHRHALLRGETEAGADAIAQAELARVAAAQTMTTRRPAPRPPDERSALGTGLENDIRHAVRQIWMRPGYTAAVVLTLSVGIGGCAAVYSLFTALLRTPLPFPAPEELVFVWEADAQDLSQHATVAAPNYQDWQRGTSSFASMGIYQTESFNLASEGDPEQIGGVRASASVFDVIGVPAAYGRTFSEEEERAGRQVVVISDAVWQRHFGRDPAVLGRSVRLNGQLHEVIGVLPPHFTFPSQRTGAWVPLVLTPDEQRRDWHAFRVIARLKPTVTFEQARDEVERLGDALRHRYPDHAGDSATLERMEELGLADARRLLMVLAGAVALVMMIACVNVAGLQVALGLARRREFATRLSLGGRRAHLGRLAVTESTLVSLLGCAGGLVVAFLVTRSFDLLLPEGFRTLPLRGDVAITLDGRAVALSVAVSLLCALIFALAPLRALGAESLQPLLRSGDRGATQLGTRARRLLVAAEIALAVVVLTAAGLLVRSVTLVWQQAPGFDASNILAVDVSVPQERPFAAADRQAFCEDLTREAMALPGISQSSAVDLLPLAGGNANRIFTTEDGVQPAEGQLIVAEFRVVCPGYFATLGIPLVRGRDFTHRDRDGAPGVMIVNRAFVDRYLPGAPAIGRRVKLGRTESANPWLLIVGVAENVRQFGLEERPSPEMYVPYSQAASPAMTVIAKTAGHPLAWERGLRAAIRQVDPAIPAANARSMEQVIAGSVRWRETPMRLVSGFALVGLLLSAIGVYSVLAFYVSQRSREFGVRVALGASRRALVALVLRQSAVPVAVGVLIGIVGSLATGRLLSSWLYEVQPGDPIVLTTIVALLIIVSVASGWVPARRAATVDPTIALRDE